MDYNLPHDSTEKTKIINDNNHTEDNSSNFHFSQSKQSNFNSNFINSSDVPEFEDEIDSLLALEESFNLPETSKKHISDEDLPLDSFNFPASKKINLGDNSSSKTLKNHPPFETSLTHFEKNSFISSGASNLSESTNIHKIDYYVPSPHGRLTLATNSKGKTLFIPRRSEASKRFDSSLLKKNQAARKGLLSVSIYAILDKLDLKKTIETTPKPETFNKRKNTQTDKLWVEKYRPKKFLDLIGDQRLNREALEWLKQWDYCVFNKKVGKVSHGLYTPSDKQTQTSDFLKRPEHKILLLCGPPGLGKTSLAHAIGQQCGYNCIEINASDDRAGTGVKERISNALETRSMFGEKKPNLVIIDEIDGVSNAGGNQSFINTLLNLASIDETLASKKDTKKKPKILKRPIICICNDPFVPALRALRPHSKILNFKKSPTALIVEHLKEICSSEKVSISSHSLTALCEITDGDLRSCLNSLQFLSESNNHNITYEMISENSTGAKDTSKSLFSIWDSIFQLPSSRFSLSQKRVFDDVDNQSLKAKYLDLLVSYVFTHGGFNIIIDGCFENYLNAKYIDTYMEKVCLAGEWLTWFDILDNRVNTQQQLGLFSYSAYPIVAFHNIFATASPKRIEFPKLDRKYREVFKTNSSILASFYDSLSPLIRRSFSRQLQSLYFVFYALQIIDIESHEINLQLMKPQDKLHIQNIVLKMIALNLRYNQNRNSENSISFELEPPLNLLIKFGMTGSPSASYFGSASQNEIKKFINHEIEIESVRQKEIVIQSKLKPSTDSGFKQTEHAKPNTSENVKPSFHDIPKPIIKLANLSMPEKSIRSNPFSAFVRRSKNEISDSNSPVSNRPKSWFVYLDGYSNAVRTPLYMDEL